MRRELFIFFIGTHLVSLGDDGGALARLQVRHGSGRGLGLSVLELGLLGRHGLSQGLDLQNI